MKQIAIGPVHANAPRDGRNPLSAPYFGGASTSAVLLAPLAYAFSTNLVIYVRTSRQSRCILLGGHTHQWLALDMDGQRCRSLSYKTNGAAPRPGHHPDANVGNDWTIPRFSFLVACTIMPAHYERRFCRLFSPGPTGTARLPEHYSISDSAQPCEDRSS